jgi:hypothetical protein
MIAGLFNDVCQCHNEKEFTPTLIFLTVMAGFLSPSARDAEDSASLISVKSVAPSPDTLTSMFSIEIWVRLAPDFVF